jgi:hypothetical protein
MNGPESSNTLPDVTFTDMRNAANTISNTVSNVARLPQDIMNSGMRAAGTAAGTFTDMRNAANTISNTVSNVARLPEEIARARNANYQEYIRRRDIRRKRRYERQLQEEYERKKMQQNLDVQTPDPSQPQTNVTSVDVNQQTQIQGQTEVLVTENATIDGTAGNVSVPPSAPSGPPSGSPSGGPLVPADPASPSGPPSDPPSGPPNGPPSDPPSGPPNGPPIGGGDNREPPVDVSAIPYGVDQNVDSKRELDLHQVNVPYVQLGTPAELDMYKAAGGFVQEAAKMSTKFAADMYGFQGLGAITEHFYDTYQKYNFPYSFSEQSGASAAKRLRRTMFGRPLLAPSAYLTGGLAVLPYGLQPPVDEPRNNRNQVALMHQDAQNFMRYANIQI